MLLAVQYLSVPVHSIIYSGNTVSVARLGQIPRPIWQHWSQPQLNVISGLFATELSSSMADAGLVDTLLRLVEEAEDGVDSLQVAGGLGLDHQAVVGAVKSLIALGEVS